MYSLAKLSHPTPSDRSTSNDYQKSLLKTKGPKLFGSKTESDTTPCYRKISTPILQCKKNQDVISANEKDYPTDYQWARTPTTAFLEVKNQIPEDKVERDGIKYIKNSIGAHGSEEKLSSAMLLMGGLVLETENDANEHRTGAGTVSKMADSNEVQYAEVKVFQGKW